MAKQRIALKKQMWRSAERDAPDSGRQWIDQRQLLRPATLHPENCPAVRPSDHSASLPNWF